MGKLYYRYPGGNRVELQGDFRSVENLKEVKGFVLSDFTGRQLYQFQEGLVQKGAPKFVPVVADKQSYFESAGVFLEELIETNLEKAIFSRVKQSTTALTHVEMFERLESAYPSAFVYLLDSSILGCWIGASPERLCSYSSGKFTTVSLAGTLPVENENTWTEKEYREQAAVTDFIVAAVSKFSSDVVVGGLEEIHAGPVRHLSQTISSVLEEEFVHKLIEELHPTPAVSGVPRNQALKLIAKHERHSRSLYAGFLGEYGATSCDLYVNLRCAQLVKSDVYCFVGGGFNSQSNIEKEWVETENKAKTIFNILQNK